MPSWAPMQFNTALSFCILGIIAALPNKSTVSKILGASLFAFCGVTFVQYFGFNFGIDELFYEDPWVTTKTSSPGRMAPNTAICFMLGGIAVFLRGEKGTLPLSAVFGISLTSVVGYILSLQSHTWGNMTSMAFSTAFLFLWLSFFKIQDQLHISHIRKAELMKTQHELERSNEELTKFAYIASHDLKSPLRGINNLVVWIREELENVESEQVDEYFDLLCGRVTRMDNLINGLLEYSRIGRTNTDKELVDLNEVFNETVSFLSVDKDRFSISSDRLPKLFVNKVRIQQVLSNLIDNAMKHHDKPSGRIHLHYYRNKHEHVFCVSDDGPGIEEKYFEKIFQLFQTLHSKDVREATGIGLTLVNKIIQEEYGGRVWVESSLKTGTKFYFSLKENDDGNTYH